LHKLLITALGALGKKGRIGAISPCRPFCCHCLSPEGFGWGSPTGGPELHLPPARGGWERGGGPQGTPWGWVIAGSAAGLMSTLMNGTQGAGAALGSSALGCPLLTRRHSGAAGCSAALQWVESSPERHPPGPPGHPGAVAMAQPGMGMGHGQSSSTVPGTTLSPTAT